jgi:hypothetical protein
MRKRTNITLKPEIDILLRELAARTKLKMSTIVENGILIIKEIEDGKEGYGK